MAKRSGRSRSFSEKCLTVSVDTVVVISVALAAAYLINIHFLTAPTASQAFMFP